MPYLRYIPGTKDAAKFPGTRFPSKGEWSREVCEKAWREMGGYGRIEIVDENGSDERDLALEIRENGPEQREPDRANESDSLASISTRPKGA